MFVYRSLLACLLAAALHAENIKDVEYGRAGKTVLRLDAHIPDGAGPFAAVIVVHGGGWIIGEKTVRVQPLFQPLTDARFAWFSISYRLAADVMGNPMGSVLQLGAADNDVRQAILYVKEHAAEYRVNPHKIALLGESAGGQLAAMAALRPNLGGEVQGVVALYTPTDLVNLARNSSMIPVSVRTAVKGTLFDNLLMTGLTELSPVNWVSSKAPPFLLIHGTEDPWVPFAQSERFCQMMKAEGASCELYPMKGAGHGILYWERYHQTAYKAEMVRWLQQVLGQT